MQTVSDLKVKVFADGADKATMLELYSNAWVKGFTTNPTLMRKAGVTDYESFAHEILSCIKDRPVALEVLADDIETMERQARYLAAWGENVYVKIPITNTKGDSTLAAVRRLSREGIKLNVTALLTLQQVRDSAAALADGAPACISVFAGRIADTGRDPVPIMTEAGEIVHRYPQIELIWASPREVLNVFQANSISCDIITATPDILKKLSLVGKDLLEYSRETVSMFYEDACKSGFVLSGCPQELRAGPAVAAAAPAREVA